MQPFKIEFYAYCDNEQQAQELGKTLYDFVNEKRLQGIAVRADKIADAINKFKNNIFVTNFLKQ